jgi:hypothetical protein
MSLGGLVFATALAASTACGGPPPDQEDGSGLEREAFISAYVDLRLAAMRNGEMMDVRLRETVLANHHITEDDLLAFAEAHGRDIEYMNDVWQEVSRRLDSLRTTLSPEG